MSFANTSRKQAGGFQKGQSGNPRGRPAGSRNNATLACEVLLEGQAQALTQKAVEMALGGDTVALKLCLERIYPARKDRPVTFALPPITSTRDAAEIAAAVAEAVAAGHLTPSEAVEIGRVLEIYIKAYETAELNDRVARVEQVTDAELMRFVRNGSGGNATTRLITIGSD
ncbi:DUF5681 domain-containing protein [Bradyrhizobium sp. UFLA05-112]